MNPKLGQSFKNLSELEPSHELVGFILAKIRREIDKNAREQKAMVWAGLFGSALTAVYVASVFGQEILQSEFWRIVSLAGTDINTVTGNWYDYALSLLETFPAVYAALMLAPIFVLLLSLNAYFNLAAKNNHKHI